MRIVKQQAKGVVIVFAVVLFVVSNICSVAVATPTSELEPYLGVNINWKQFEGESITLASPASTAEQWGDYIHIFEKLTGIKVTIEGYPEDALRQKTYTDLIMRTGIYDVVVVDPMYVPIYAEGGTLEELPKYLNDSKLTDEGWYGLNDIFVSLREVLSWKGKLYALPYSSETTLLIYKKSLFEEKGVKVPETMGELMSAAEALNDPANNLYGIGMRGKRGGGDNVYIWAGFFLAYGGEWFDANWEPTFNSVEGVAAAEFYAEIMQKYAPPGASSWTWAEPYEALMHGRLAMCIDCTDFGFDVWKPSESSSVGDYWFAPLPKGPTGKRAPSLFGWGLAISSSSTNKEAAWLLIQWLTSKPFMEDFCLQTYAGANTRRSIFEGDRDEKEFGEYGNIIEMYINGLENASVNYRPRVPEWPEIGDEVGIAIEIAITGKESAKAALDKAAARVRDIMEAAGYYKKK